MPLPAWEPTSEQREQYERDGYFIARHLLPRDTAIEMRGVIKNELLAPEPEGRPDADPMGPMDDSVAGRLARFRKLGFYCVQSPLIWHSFHAGPEVMAIVRWLLGDDILMKFNSVFVKPARTGSATPWHQDNGLWRDGETEPANAWMALDPATRENGCLQFIPGSHRTEIVEHVLYPDSIHGELPRERVAEMIDRHGVHHIELESGDAVFWYSSLWHYSPPNTSPNNRIAIAGVWTTPRLAISRPHRFSNYRWCLRAGQVCEAFPPETFPVEVDDVSPPSPFPRVEPDQRQPPVEQVKGSSGLAVE